LKTTGAWLRGLVHALAVGAEDLRQRGEIDIAVVDREIPAAVELFLERALVAETAVVVHDAHHGDALAHRGFQLADVAHHAHVADRGHHRLAWPR